MGEVEAFAKLLSEQPAWAPLLLVLCGALFLWRAWREDRLERNRIQEARIADFRAVAEANTRSNIEVAVAIREIAEEYKALRQEIAQRGRSR